MRYHFNRCSFFSILGALGIASVFSCGLSGCSTARTEALERRQGWMNEMADQRAERRAIRGENMDARSEALFDAM